MTLTASSDDASKIIPKPWKGLSGDEESLDVWGFRDTRFTVNDRGNVVLTGNRYPLSQQELPTLLPWIRQVMELSLDLRDTHSPRYPPRIPEPRRNEKFLQALQQFLKPDQVVSSPLVRLRHGHGHTQGDMYSIKYGDMKRVPDLVVYPEDEEEVPLLVRAALDHDVCLIPYGGGTNVTEALSCPEKEERMIVSVDMKGLNRILWIDPVNRTARIQAGAVGRAIMDQLALHGFTIGHEPDSVEFSTLGGWIATNASGMKKNRYGNIEDLVLDMNVVTPSGEFKRSNIFPRESAGIDPRLLIFGSEGNWGIITSAVVKLFRLPEVQKYGSILFPSFDDGVEFLYELTQTGNLPASIRLVDNLQFQFGLNLKPKSEGAKAIKSALEKFFVTRIKGYDGQKMVAATLVFEGGRGEVKKQEKGVYRIAKRHGGLPAGSENGKRGYALTFSIAYIRDFVMNYHVLAESFETSVPWSRVLPLCNNVKKRLLEEHSKRRLPGKPFVTCRVTQVYETGACVYFYFGFGHQGIENPSEVYAEIERAAREEILKQGGSLSHHHGIGKLRERFLPQIKSEGLLTWKKKVKEAVDPQNIFGCRNQGL